jgi:multidrug efflux system membrane fusion protein
LFDGALVDEKPLVASAAPAADAGATAKQAKTGSAD